MSQELKELRAIKKRAKQELKQWRGYNQDNYSWRAKDVIATIKDILGESL